MINFTKALEVDIRARSGGTKASELDSTEFVYGGGAGNFSQPSKVMTEELDFPTMESMYKVNVWVRAIIDKIVKRSVSVNPIVKAMLRKPTDIPTRKQNKRIEAIENLISVPNAMQQSFDHIRTQLFTDILIWDASALELVNDKNSVNEIYAVSGDSIRLNVDKRGIFKSPKNAYIQKDLTTQKSIATFAQNEMVYFMQYPRAKRVYGLSPLESLRQTVTGELFSSDFNIQRFVNDATPRIAIMFEKLGLGQGGAAMERLRQWWDSELKGKPHKPILIGSENGEIKFEKVGLTNEDMQFQEYSRWLLSKIMSVYHMQAAVLGVIEVNQGRINAQYQEEQFKKDALKPLLKTFSNQFNTMAIWSSLNFGWNDIYLEWEGLDILDRKHEAEIHEIYLRQGVFTINMVLQQLGMDAVSWGDVPYLLNQMVPIDIKSNMPRPALPPIGAIEKLFSNFFIDNENNEFDIAKWLSYGLTKGSIIPTGLEKIEDVDLNDAIRKIKREREKILSKKTFLLSDNKGNDID